MLYPAGILATIVLIILLIPVGVGVVVGGIGAAWSRRRGGTLVGGFWRSMVPPWPIGWFWVWASTRTAHRLMRGEQSFSELPGGGTPRGYEASEDDGAESGGLIF